MMQTQPTRTASTTTPSLVSDVMTRAVVVAHEGAPFKEVAASLIRNRISAVPVIDEQRRVIGVVSESDLLTRIAGDDGAAPWGYPRTHARSQQKVHALVAADLMTSPAVTVTDTASIADAARLAAQARVRRLPVLDRVGVLVGIVTRGDLLRVYLRSDSDIQRDLDTALRDVVPIDHPHIDATVAEGVITVEGPTESAALRDRILARVGAIPGAVDVLDHLRKETR